MRLIDADALKKVISEYIDEYSALDNEGYHNEKWCAMKEAEMAIDNAPTVGYPFYQEAYQTGYEEGKNARPKGEWITHKTGLLLWEECNQCHVQVGTLGMPFCPNCGAKMGDEE